MYNLESNISCFKATEIALTNKEKYALSNDLAAIPLTLSQEVHPVALSVAASDIISNYIDQFNLIKLKEISLNGNQPFFLARNFVSTANIPKTPTNDVSPSEHSWRIQAAALLGLLRLSGHLPASFLDEMGGRLCHMVMPARNSEKSYLSSTKN